METIKAIKDAERKGRLKAYEDVIQAINTSSIDVPEFDSVCKRMDFRMGALARESAICNAIYELIGAEMR